MHRSIQDISLAYLIKTLKLSKDNEMLQSIGHALMNYMREVIIKEDFPSMKILAQHGEAFLAYRHLFEDEITSSLGGELGGKQTA